MFLLWFLLVLFLGVVRFCFIVFCSVCSWFWPILLHGIDIRRQRSGSFFYFLWLFDSNGRRVFAFPKTISMWLLNIRRINKNCRRNVINLGGWRIAIFGDKANGTVKKWEKSLKRRFLTNVEIDIFSIGK